jgi:hypothetical protein
MPSRIFFFADEDQEAVGKCHVNFELQRVVLFFGCKTMKTDANRIERRTRTNLEGRRSRLDDTSAGLTHQPVENVTSCFLIKQSGPSNTYFHLWKET